jgi:hypothetical protein
LKPPAACGRKMGLSYVITGTKGAISFTQERMAELKLYLHDDPVTVRVPHPARRPGTPGLRRVLHGRRPWDWL